MLPDIQDIGLDKVPPVVMAHTLTSWGWSIELACSHISTAICPKYHSGDDLMWLN